MTLYLKYRPQTLDELDLANVRDQLKKIVASGNIPHGLLFAGPKGAGKTSAARILAKIVNCEKLGKDGEPCNKCGQCVSIAKGNNIDVIEIDGASNRGIDDIRSLKESIMLAPNSAKKKVYIVDEAHMLTLEASNAFLKTLEEPPEHVLFILATTDPQKLPETVLSRLVAVNFRKATDAEIERQLKRVAQGEKVEIDAEAIKAIAKLADGSFRDAVKILEQLMTAEGNKIDSAAVTKFAASGQVFQVEEFLTLIRRKDPQEILSQITKLTSEGVSTRSLIDSLIEKTRETILDSDSIRLIELLIEAKSRLRDAFIPELPLEIALVKFCRSENSVGKDNQLPEPPRIVVSARAEAAVVPKMSVPAGQKVDADVWRQILVTAKTRNTTVEALLRAAEPLGYDGHSLTLGVYYKFHKERLEVVQNKRTLEEVVTQIFGNPVEVVYTLTEKKMEPTKDEPLTSTADKDIISAAKEIFGQS